MKFPKELNENESDLKKNTQKSNGNIETKTLEENNGIILEEDDTSNRAIEPNTTALIPPWIRNTLGLSEKGSRSNHRCLKTLRTSGDRLLAGEKGKMKSDPDDAFLKSNLSLEPSCSNDVVEVNIGNEADFSEEVSDVERKSSLAWNGKASKHNQYDCNIFGVTKDTRIARPELTSIDVVVPIEEPDEEKRKVRVHKTKNKARKKFSLGALKNEAFKSDPDILCKGNTRQFCQKTDIGILNSNGIKQLDARILLLCGKNTIDNLTEEDVSLLQDMKNQIGHKEGFEKLFSEIKESALLGRSLNKEVIDGKKERPEKKEEKDTNEKMKKERVKVLTKMEFDDTPSVKDLLGKTDESEMKIINNILNKSKAMEEERKYIEEIRKHYEKKKQNQHKLVKYSQEVELEKDRKTMEKCRTFPHKVNPDKEKKSKWRHGDVSVMERTVSEILQKFIKFYRFQVPPDIVTSMKKNIIQTLQSEYPETSVKKNLDVIFSVQEELKNMETEKDSPRSLLMEEREDKSKIGDRQVDETVYKESEIDSEENFVSKDISIDNKYVKNPFRTILANIKETRSVQENDAGREQNFKDLKNDFEICLKSIQTQLDITGSKLCSIILEKGEVQDVPDEKLRIFHDFSTGMTEFIKLYNEKLSTGSPEGDNTSVKVCHCNTAVTIKPNCHQFSQTQEKELTKNGTQTDCADFCNSTDLASGIYRIIKTAELGSFYLYPETIDQVEVKTTGSEACKPCGKDVFDTYKNEVLKSISRETFLSEKIPSVNISKKLQRVFRSDCLGLNKIDLGELTKTESKISILNILSENPSGEKQELPLLISEGEESNPKGDVNRDDQEVLKSESYHVGCVWFWNGEKMNPGVDLKVHVEDLLREKLREILNEVRVKEEVKSSETEKEKEKTALVVDAGTNVIRDRSTEKNLEIRKTHGKFCITNSNHLETDMTPFIFRGSNKQEKNPNIQIPTEDKTLQGLDIDNFVKSVREVGTQNSQHTFVSLNITKLRPRSKLCTVAKFSKQRPRKHISSQKRRSERPRTSSAKGVSFAENVGEAKKVKLEFREPDPVCSSNDKSSSNDGNLRECFSLISNESSSSSDGPVRVKLIGIEVSKEKTMSEEGEFYGISGKETKKLSSDEERESLRELPKKFKHWELIENVLNRVNQKEKDSLWNDIRDFVKKKIGRDINDEGAREVCIEIEQDVPKFIKGKPNQAVVAKGNYTRNEGDVEVEVDLTLDDLERILRHRQRKLRRHNNYHKMRTDSKNSFTSSGTSSADSRSYNNNYSSFGDNDYGNCTEIKMSKNEN